MIGAAVLVTAALATAALVSVSSQEFEGAAAGTVVTTLAVRPFGAGSVDGALGASVARLVGDRLLDGMHPLLSEPAGRPRPAALEGTLGRTGRVLVAHAVLRDADGQPLAAADAQVSADSIGRLADQLTVVLLARLNGLPEAHQPDLAARALPAARAYLAAEVAYRRDRLEDAQRLYRDALAVDTTLALAALGLAKSGGLGWSAHARSGRHGDALAWRLAGRLSASDRVLFDAYRGRPDPASHTLAARLALWRDTYQRLPDRAEPAYEYASALYHSGGYVGDRAAAWALAAGLLRHAVALDSTWALPYAMLIPLTAAARDTAALRALEARHAALHPDPAAATYVRWRTGIALGDAARTTALRAALDTVRDGILRRVAGLAALDGTGLADADRAARVLTSRGNTPAARVRALALVRQYALNRGHAAEAEQAIAGLRSIEPLPLGTIPNVVSARQLVLSDALFGGERPERAEAAARDVAASTPPDRIPAPAARTVAQVERCLAGLWWLRTGQVAAARTALADARTAGPPRPEDVPADVSPALCAATLDAALAAATHARDALPRLARLDTLAATGPAVFGAAFVNRVVADLWAARGEPRRALVALRRRRYDWDAGPEYLAPALLQEATLAAAVGDSAGARCALAHHLVLRDPTRPEVGRADAPARAMFARLAVAPPTATWAACRR